MPRKIIVSVVVSLAALAVGGGALFALIATAPQAPRSDVMPPAMLVRVETLTPQTVVEPVTGYGTARADRYALVTAQIAGEIVELSPKFHVGASVERGELLVRIDERDHMSNLERARSVLAADEARLKQLDVEADNVERLIEIAENETQIAEREYQRVSRLLEAGQAPRRELDVARQAYDRARREQRGLINQKMLIPEQRAVLTANRDLHRAEVDLAQLEVERCRVLAPFDGRLEECRVEIGERTAPGGPLFAVLDPTLIEVPIEIPVSLRERVAVGAACQLTLETNSASEWQGEVARIAPRASETTRTFSLFVEVRNDRQTHELMPGMFVRAQIDGPLLHDVIVIPRGAVQAGRVFIYNDGIARAVPVEVIRRLGDQTVVDGLANGDRLITTNLDALYDGAPVRLGDETPDDADDGSEMQTVEPANQA